MRKSLLSFPGFVILAAMLSAALTIGARPAHSQETVQVTTVVTVLGPNYTPPPAIGRDDVAVYEGKDKREVTGWVPAQGDKATLELAILIDEADRNELGLQFTDLTSFIKSQPKTTGIGIFYANNGTILPASQFSTDHDAVAKTLRLPFGTFGAYASIYLSLSDLISRCPVTGARREVLLLSDGIDRFRGDPFSPDVDAALEHAQKAGVIIHTLYSSGVGRFGRNMFRVNYGQSNLAKIADGTGGEAFFQGLQTPISFGPFLQQLDMVLKNQYFLTFAAERSKKEKGELKSFRIRTEQRNVEISHADKILVPGS